MSLRVFMAFFLSWSFSYLTTQSGAEKTRILSRYLDDQNILEVRILNPDPEAADYSIWVETDDDMHDEFFPSKCPNKSSAAFICEVRGIPTDHIRNYITLIRAKNSRDREVGEILRNSTLITIPSPAVKFKPIVTDSTRILNSTTTLSLSSKQPAEQPLPILEILLVVFAALVITVVVLVIYIKCPVCKPIRPCIVENIEVNFRNETSCFLRLEEYPCLQNRRSDLQNGLLCASSTNETDQCDVERCSCDTRNGYPDFQGDPFPIPQERLFTDATETGPPPYSLHPFSMHRYPRSQGRQPVPRQTHDVTYDETEQHYVPYTFVPPVPSELFSDTISMALQEINDRNEETWK